MSLSTNNSVCCHCAELNQSNDKKAHNKKEAENSILKTAIAEIKDLVDLGSINPLSALGWKSGLNHIKFNRHEIAHCKNLQFTQREYPSNLLNQNFSARVVRGGLFIAFREETCVLNRDGIVVFLLSDGIKFGETLETKLTNNNLDRTFYFSEIVPEIIDDMCDLGIYGAVYKAITTNTDQNKLVYTTPLSNDLIFLALL